MSQYPRGTKVEFVGKPPGRPDQESSAKHYVDKYGVQVGDSGTVVRVKNGWWRVSFTRQDGTRAVAVPMRLDDIKKRKLDDDVEDELVKRLKRLTTGESERLTQFDVVTDDREVLDKIIEEERVARDQKHLTNEDTTAFVAGFGNLNAQQLQALDRLGWRRDRWEQLQGSLTTNAEPVQPPMNENFGFDEQPSPGAVVDIRVDDKGKRSQVEMREDMYSNWWEKEAKLKAELVHAHEAAAGAAASAAAANASAAAAGEAAADALTELEEVKLQLISARTLIQLKDKTIAQLRGEPTFESWGDWVVA